MTFNSIEEAIADFRDGKLLIVVDDEDRENEGDFCLAAEKVTPEKINFMAKHGRGLICVAMPSERLEALDLHPMVPDNTARLGTSFTVSVDAKRNTTTGISAHDRAETILQLIAPATKPTDLARPGHIFPLRAQPGGVLTRAGHTEAVVDLSRLAGLYPAGVLCEIMDEDGSMARVPRLMQLAEQFAIKIVTIRDLIEYRRRKEKLVRRIVTTRFPSRYGNFMLHLYESDIDENHHLAVVKGDVSTGEPTLVRVHSQCLTGDILGSLRCDCGEQLGRALQQIEQEGRGVLLYMRQEGRGIGLANKIRAYKLQDDGKDTVEANEALGFKADLRHYGIGAQILYDLGIRQIRLLTNNPKKIVGLEGYGLQVVARVPIQVPANEANQRYLETKRNKLGHLLVDELEAK
ncbi:MAG: bifunctional 3,4-dihydroxy-2-butanone-4-phosphate synthase/GTP cyclohydrolase II [candidate division KSB1 bacterium]|nr:bifunctional 3,4-dihydroxy-2-butanone-4-phosphate synthase/GTP cyclohydrolase II [candidate division KSB1 bacterium]MDZ7368937.1 bifunctional 3,4-dihydroxy-2-butanone-4-phosphate synthase/GTP cyclohydrolase II [candidate division KSB1 bacterium]MDZ7406925.1 bifunctional 3,4-dihydroxy-2-butanone-4-phosphate synthase/GTP cyclohydrolase II [candidate division KSB1 bacterium]